MVDTPNQSARQVLLDLADRCEREEPSRELDAEIAVACRMAHDFDESVFTVPCIWRVVGDDVSIGHYLKPGEWWPKATRVPARFSSSLDAAVTLVPDGFAWSAGAETRGDASVDKWGEISEQGTAKTAALALCAASLRARAEAL